MFWFIFTVWAIFSIICGILSEKYHKDFFGFLFLISIPIILYLPLFLQKII